MTACASLAHLRNLFAVLWLRYRETDTRLLSGRFWDIMLWASFMSFVGIGLYLAITKLGKLFS